MKNLKAKAVGAISQFFAILSFILSGYVIANAQVTTPNHFTTVWQGENGQNHMNFMVVSAINENLQLNANDEIAVFSGLSCVGAKKLTQPIVAGSSSTYLTFTASADDGSKNGYVVNDTIIFKIWDSKNQKEMVVKAVKYRNDISSWLTSGRFTLGTTAVVELISFTEYTQSIPLVAGTNFFSTYIQPTNPSMSLVMKPLCTLSTTVKVVDEASKTFEYQTTTKSWVNNIGAVSKTEGYSITLNFSSMLNVTGKMIALPLDIPLNLGWNFISYPRTDQVNALTVVQPLINLKKLVKVQDEKGNTIEKIKGTWRNNIGNFIPGKAYKISVNAATVLTIQSSYPKSGTITQQLEKAEFFRSDYEGNGLDHMNIHLDGLAGSGLSAGDELAAFDGNVCVGTLKLTGDHFSNNLASLIASSASGINIPDGFISGNSISIYVWKKLDNEKFEMQAESVVGELVYAKNSSILIKTKSSITAAKSIKESVEIEIFPNPTPNTFTVRFSRMPENGSVIEVTDIAGRRITSRTVSGISEKFDLGDQPAGLYLLKSIIGTQNTIQKLIIN